MPFSIELLFDVPIETRLVDGWTRLAELSRSRYMLDNGVLPHVALSVTANADPPGTLHRAICQLASETEGACLPVHGVDCFAGRERVIYLAVEKTDWLRETHAAALSVLEELGLGCDPLYQAPRWVPHCTLAAGLEADQGEDLLCQARSMDWPSVLPVTRIGIVVYPPSRLSGQWPLG